MALKRHNRLCFFSFAETWLTVVTRRFHALIPHKRRKKIPLCRKCFAIRILGEQNYIDVANQEFERLTTRKHRGIKET